MVDQRHGSQYADPYADLRTESRRGALHDSRESWRVKLEGIVSAQSPPTHIDSVEQQADGNLRFLFTPIVPSALSRVQTSMTLFLAGLGSHGFVTRTPSTAGPGTVARDRVESFYVDLCPDADVIQERRARAARAFFSWPMLALLVFLALLGYCVEQLQQHYVGYSDPFAHQLDAAKKGWDQYVDGT